MMPRTQVSAYIEWDSSDFNGLADDAASQALDRGADWVYTHDDNVRRALEACAQINFRLCFDGARRGEGDSAAGSALIAYYPSGERELLFRAGRLLGRLRSAFLAEALAAEFSLDLFFLLLNSGRWSCANRMRLTSNEQKVWVSWGSLGAHLGFSGDLSGVSGRCENAGRPSRPPRATSPRRDTGGVLSPKSVPSKLPVPTLVFTYSVKFRAGSSAWSYLPSSVPPGSG